MILRVFSLQTWRGAQRCLFTSISEAKASVKLDSSTRGHAEPAPTPVPWPEVRDDTDEGETAGGGGEVTKRSCKISG